MRYYEDDFDIQLESSSLLSIAFLYCSNRSRVSKG